VDLDLDGVADFSLTYGYGTDAPSVGKHFTLGSLLKNVFAAPRDALSFAIAIPLEARSSVLDFVNGTAQSLIRNAFGQDAVKVFNALTLVPRIQDEMWLGEAEFLSGCIRDGTCDPLLLASLPVAAALRDAYKRYRPVSELLPAPVVDILRGTVPDYVLDQARWVFSAPPDFSAIPGYLNTAIRLNPLDPVAHAVTVGDVMIFTDPLALSCGSGDLAHLLHELRHVETYLSFNRNAIKSIEPFSRLYLTHRDSLEVEAQSTGTTRANAVSQKLGC
jgi:hypothetical protein